MLNKDAKIGNQFSPDLKRALAVLKRDPKNTGAHIQAGVFFSQEKIYDRAVFHLKKAHNGDKSNLLILEKLCDVLINDRNALQAKKYARKMLALKKKDPTVMKTMAQVAEANGEIKKALEWINLALEQNPDDETNLFYKANYLSQAGNTEESLETHKRILEINPFAGESWWPIAQLQKLDMDNAKPILDQIDNTLGKNPGQDTKRALHFSAGKIRQDIGEYPEAFEHFTKANLLHDKQISADRIIAANINIRETFTKDYLENSRKLGNSEYRPIFILGQTRSGTTLTESLCASHSKVSAGGELPYFTDLSKKMDFSSTIENQYRDNVYRLSPKDIKNLTNEMISKASPLLKKGTRLTDKMPHNFLHVGMISVLFPNAHIIHCRRHPMDNLLSIFSNPMLDYHKEYKSKLETLGTYYRNYVQIMEYWKEVCPIEIHEVFYEDLVTNTEDVARQMIDYAGLEWEDQVMERSNSQSSVKTLSVWQVRQPVFQTSKGKWLNYEKELEPLRDMLSDEIAQYEEQLAKLDSN